MYANLSPDFALPLHPHCPYPPTCPHRIAVFHCRRYYHLLWYRDTFNMWGFVKREAKGLTNYDAHLDFRLARNWPTHFSAHGGFFSLSLPINLTCRIYASCTFDIDGLKSCFCGSPLLLMHSWRRCSTWKCQNVNFTLPIPSKQNLQLCSQRQNLQQVENSWTLTRSSVPASRVD